MNKKISPQTETEALTVAKATQKQGQSKEQTKLIAKGIEKGISEYKKQQKVKTRARDKFKKQQNKNRTDKGLSNDQTVENSNDESKKVVNFMVILPWFLLLLTWLGFYLEQFI